MESKNSGEEVSISLMAKEKVSFIITQAAGLHGSLYFGAGHPRQWVGKAYITKTSRVYN